MTTEHLDVLIVGAGLSGIGAGHYIQDRCPWASYAIFEARDAIGGTWDLFRYPGIRSDSDMYTLGYTFRPWDGEKAIADGDSILQYIRDTAAEEGIDAQIRFNHKILSLDWSSDDALWTITAEKSDGTKTETVTVTANFVFSCSGYYRYDQGYQPDWDGMDTFEGQIIHPQHWPEDLDYDDKKIVVIGSGATAITLIPSLAERAAHVTMLQRSPSYVISVPGKNPIVPLLKAVTPAKWEGDVVRWFNALITQGSFRLSRLFPKVMANVLKKQVGARLPKEFDVDTHFTPHYNPWDQRMCVVPDGDLFKAIRSGDASVVTDHIDTFTENGIRVSSGEELEADIVVSATGLQMLYLGGIDVTVDGEKVDASEHLVYKGMMLEGVPNAAVAIGYTNASWTLKCDLTCDYVTRLLNHMHETGMRQCTAINRDPSVREEPLLGLTSGYVTRAAHMFPKAGDRFPWRVHQSYLADYRAMKRADIEDQAMTFSNPAPRAERQPA